MANRLYTQFKGSLEKGVVFLFATITGTGASAPTLNNFTVSQGVGTLGTAATGGFAGVKSIAYNGVGDYTFTFQDNYTRLLGCIVNAEAVDGSTTPLVTQAWIKASSPTASGGATVRLLFYLSAPGTPADANTNDRIHLTFIFSNSTAVA